MLTSLVRYINTKQLTYKLIVQESPLCDLVPMKNNDKAYIWSANDFSEEESKLEKFALRLQTVESKKNEVINYECRC